MTMTQMDKLFEAADDVILENVGLQFIAHKSVRNAGALLLVLGRLYDAKQIDHAEYMEWVNEASKYLFFLR